MSKYTTELRFICEELSGYEESQDETNVATVIETARPLIFNFEYPSYTDEQKKRLETKILKRYYTQEIAYETYGRWHLALDERMNSIMPYYVKLYASADLEFDPLNDIDMTTTRINSGSETNKETSASETNASDKRNEWNLYSDTPQGGISGLESNTYLTNATHDTADNSTGTTGSMNTEGSKTSTDNGSEHVSGKSASKSYAELLTEYRNTILNIDNEIVDNLYDLFMLIW